MFLLFLAIWGLNYRRVPLDQKLEYDQRRVTREAAIRLGTYAVREVNALHAAAHEPERRGDGPALETAFASAERMLGSERLAVHRSCPSVRCSSGISAAAAIDGMTDPFFLEVIINPDTLPFERPFVLTHEWAHLAGYANEAEANFVAWLACTQGDAMARYSGWLAIFEHVAASLPRADRAALAAQLAAGPRRDLLARRRPVRAGDAGRPRSRARCLRYVSARQSCQRRGGQLRGGRAAHARRGPGGWRKPEAAVSDVFRVQARGLSSRPDRIQLVELGGLDRRRVVAGPQVVGPGWRPVALEDRDLAPLSPSALMATVRLASGQRYADPFVGVAQPRRVDAWRTAGAALHRDALDPSTRALTRAATGRRS